MPRTRPRTALNPFFLSFSLFFTCRLLWHFRFVSFCFVDFGTWIPALSNSCVFYFIPAGPATDFLCQAAASWSLLFSWPERCLVPFPRSNHFSSTSSCHCFSSPRLCDRGHDFGGVTLPLDLPTRFDLRLPPVDDKRGRSSSSPPQRAQSRVRRERTRCHSRCVRLAIQPGS